MRPSLIEPNFSLGFSHEIDDTPKKHGTGMARIKVALLTEVFPRNMGYLQNFLPKYLVRLGIDVHVVTMDLPPYYQMKKTEFKETYGGFADSRDLIPGAMETIQGFTLHVLRHKKVLGYMQMAGLRKKLTSIRPDIVQATAAIGWIPLQAALAKPLLGFKLFTGNHHHASVFPLAQKKLSPWSWEMLRCRLTRTLPGWMVSLLTEKCYAIAPDCADVATRFFGVPKSKISVCPLGVDSELFRPISTEQDLQSRVSMRRRLGFSDSEIVCIYTGRFSEDKNSLLLAKAVAQLVSAGQPYRGLFVGNGMQAEAIQSCAGCTIHPFVPVNELADFYRASDIGVWPTQESLSMMDAAACGLPIVANDTMTAPERLEGSGFAYKLNDLKDLVRVLVELRDLETRKSLGAIGSLRLAHEFSWESIAKRRLHDYEAALRSRASLDEDLVPGEKDLPNGLVQSESRHSAVTDARDRTISDV
jgi:glycosyltransferase involved in cell wall biosynthesis